MKSPQTDNHAKPPLLRSGRGVGAWGGMVVVAMILTGCGAGLSSGYSGPGPVTGSIGGKQGSAAEASPQIVDIHSTNCKGLELERQTRLERIAALQKSVTSELQQVPTSLAQIFARASSTPEQGTASHASIMEERALLASNASMAAKIGCPPLPAATPQ